MWEESEEEITVLRAGTQQGGQLQEWELPEVLNLERESCKHLRWTDLEQVQHCTDLPCQVAFPAHTEQGKMGPGLGWTLLLIKRRRRMRRQRRAREGQKRERENRRPILKKLCAALLRSFREQHSEKMKGSGRGNWDPREGQQPFRPNPNGFGDRTTRLRRPLIGAVRLVAGSDELIQCMSTTKHSLSNQTFYWSKRSTLNSGCPFLVGSMNIILHFTTSFICLTTQLGVRSPGKTL